MNQSTIDCPQCGHQIELNAALTDHIRNQLRVELDSQNRKRHEAMAEREAKLSELETALKAKDAALEERVKQRVTEEQDRIRAEARKHADEEFSALNATLKAELEEKTSKLRESQKKELELQKKQRELEQQREELELQVARRIDAERARIREDALRQAGESHALKLREKDDLVAQLKVQLEDARRKIEQGSQERQGEALEGDLKDRLAAGFPSDTIEDVPKGVRGADLVQRVHDAANRECGTILWESKNTKSFSNDWIPKLKNDQQQIKADVAAIVSVALPRDAEDVSLLQDIWVARNGSALALAALLRHLVIRVSRERAISAHRDGLKEHVYDYVTSQEFAGHIRAIVESHQHMLDELSAEKRSLQRIWKKREKQIVRVMDNAASMYGALEGIVAGQAQLPPIEALKLETDVKDEVA